MVFRQSRAGGTDDEACKKGKDPFGSLPFAALDLREGLQPGGSSGTLMCIVFSLFDPGQV